MKTPWRRLSSSSSEDVFKTSWSRRICSPQPYVFRRRLQYVFKTSWSKPIYSSWLYVFKTSSRRFQDVFKTSSRRFQGVLQKGLQDIFKTSSRRIIKLKLKLKFLLTRLWEAFNRYLRRSFPKTIIYRGICPGNTTSDKFMVSVQNFQER